MASAWRTTCIKLRPFLMVVFVESGSAGMDILSKLALNRGMSHYVLVVYRLFVATLVIAPFAIFVERGARPKMTLSIMAKLVIMGLLEPVIDQNLYYMGMKYTSATFAATLINILPAITFLMAWVLRLEKVNLTSNHSRAKLLGIVATVAGAVIMTIVRGPGFDLSSSSRIASTDQAKIVDASVSDAIKGSIMITVGCFCWAGFFILQAITLKSYPVELSLTAWVCSLGMVEATVVALVMEKGRWSVWSIGWDSRMLTAAYSGVFCSGLMYYMQGIVIKERGPVFVTAFSPVAMVIVVVLSAFFLAEKIYLGGVIGSLVIVMGLYLVIWGKAKDNVDSTESSSPKKNEITTVDDEKDASIQNLVSMEHNHEDNLV